MLNYTKNIFRLISVGIRAHQKMKNGISLDVVELEGYSEDFMVVHSNELAAANGVLVAFLTRSPIGMDIVVVDDHFMRMSQASKAFVLLHEEGHMLDEDIPKDVLLSERCLRAEFFADEYAAGIVGRNEAIEALHEVSRISKGYRLFGRDKELVLRINQLKETQRKEVLQYEMA